jgi:hypothetical protein
MEHWQIVITSIVGFTSITATVIGIVRFNHYTKKEVDEKFQGKDMCGTFHETQAVRNKSFTNTMVEMKEEFKELRGELIHIKDAINEAVLMFVKSNK